MSDDAKAFLANTSGGGCGCSATCRCGETCRCKTERCSEDCTCAN